MLRIKILYEQGKRNYLADALSRIKIKDDNFNIQYNNNKENNEFNKLINLNTPHITTNNNTSFKINKKNSNLKNLKFQKVREKWWYINNLKFSENFKVPFKNTNSHIYIRIFL